MPDTAGDDVRVTSVHITVVLSNGDVDTFTIPDAELTDHLSTTLCRSTYPVGAGQTVTSLRCEITAAFRGSADTGPGVYRLRRDHTDGTHTVVGRDLRVPGSEHP